MKKIFTLVLLSSFLFFPSLKGFAQTNDSVGIRQAALDYVEGFYNSDWQRMSKAVHPELAKRILIKDTLGNFMLRNMGSTELIFNTKHNKNSNVLNPDQPFKADVIIYDIYGKAATAKVVTNKFKFIDYLHLGKFDDEWKIVNVLWELTH